MTLPLWSLAPFVGVVLLVAIVPPLFPRFWRKHRLLLLATFALPTLSLSAAFNFHWIIDSFVDYASFICLLAALYAIGGGLLVSGAPKANPVTNIGYMALGALMGNFIGTLGASMLLIRPLLRSNRGRKHEKHLLVFFIFIVSNAGGLLTPLGDPPLFLGYLLGVPFWWTLKLFPIWFFVLTSLLGIFAALDSYFYLHDPDFRGPLKAETRDPFRILGRWNLVLVLIVVSALLLPPKLIPESLGLWRVVARTALLVLAVYLSNRFTPRQVSVLNNFSWEPFHEVAVVFAGIFATMIPAIKYLEMQAPSLDFAATPWNFFWASGILSGILDNAPTYVSFFALASGLGKDIVTVTLTTGHGKVISEPLLIAISCGSVFFGALTYIGNGPNLLVKAVAEGEHIKMPSFFGYILWSLIFLVPVLFLAGILFF